MWIVFMYTARALTVWEPNCHKAIQTVWPFVIIVVFHFALSYL